MDRETTLAQVKTALQARGWTLHLKQRRGRPYRLSCDRPTDVRNIACWNGLVDLRLQMHGRAHPDSGQAA